MIFPKTLVAEDNANDALLLQQAFKKGRINAAIHFVSDGMEVVEYLRGKQLFDQIASSTLPGLLLLNLRMPRLSGFGVLEWLRRYPHLRPAVIVALGNKPEERARAIALGADEYVVKGADPSVFCGLIKTLQTRFVQDATPRVPVRLAEPARLALSS